MLLLLANHCFHFHSSALQVCRPDEQRQLVDGIRGFGGKVERAHSHTTTHVLVHDGPLWAYTRGEHQQKHHHQRAMVVNNLKSGSRRSHSLLNAANNNVQHRGPGKNTPARQAAPAPAAHVHVFSFLKWLVHVQRKGLEGSAPGARQLKPRKHHSRHSHPHADAAQEPFLNQPQHGTANIFQPPPPPAAPQQQQQQRFLLGHRQGQWRSHRAAAAPLALQPPTTAPPTNPRLIFHDRLKNFHPQIFNFSSDWPHGPGAVPRLINAPVGMSPFTKAPEEMYLRAVQREMERVRDMRVRQKFKEDNIHLGPGDAAVLLPRHGAKRARIYGPKVQPGFCENCAENYKSLYDHCKTERHMKFERNQKNFERLGRFNADLYAAREPTAGKEKENATAGEGKENATGAAGLGEKRQGRALPVVPVRRLPNGEVQGNKKRRRGVNRPFSAPGKCGAGRRKFAVYEDMATIESEGDQEAPIPAFTKPRAARGGAVDARPRPPPRPHNAGHLQKRPNSRPLARCDRNTARKCRSKAAAAAALPPPPPPSTAGHGGWTGCTTTASSRRLRPRPVNHMGR